LFGFFAIERQREHTSLTESGTPYSELVLAEPIGAQPAPVIPDAFFETRYNGAWTTSSHATIRIPELLLTGNNSLNDQSTGLEI